MNKLGRCASIGAVLFMGLVVQPVGAQTTSPGSTVAPPSAQQLVSGAVAAFQKAGSAHLTSSLKAAISGSNAGQVTVNLQGDVAWRQPASAHVKGTVNLSVAGVQQALATMPVELAYANKQAAARLGTGGWNCRTLQGVNKSGTSPASIQFQPPVNLGPQTLGGVTVWQVQETGTVLVKQANGQTVRQPITIDLFIAQANLSLLRLVDTANGVAGKNTFAETASVDFSNYGEAVQVALPAACRSAAAHARGVSAQLIQKAQILFQPMPLLRRLRMHGH